MVSGRRNISYVQFMILSVLVMLLFAMQAKADSSDYGIEQIYINMPSVTVFYRGGEGSVEAMLNGEKLDLSDEGAEVFEHTGIPVEYYILADISGSIPDARFEDIKKALIDFIRDNREGDKVILYSFGDTVTRLLDGSESADKAEAVISGMVNDNQNTVLYDAIDTAADAIVTAGDTSECRRLVISISDGKDCADNTRSNTSAEETLNADGIALYTIAVENDEGDSEDTVTQYQGQYASISRNTGGLPWTAPSPETSIAEGLSYIRSSVMQGYRATYHASSNRISRKNEDFILDYGDGHILKRSVYVGRNQPDAVAPSMRVDAEEKENEIRITFSEPVVNADKSSSYSVLLDGKSIPVSQVVEEREGISYRLVFQDKLTGGDYHISVSETVTDTSNEKNPLEEQEIVYVKETEEVESETEIETETEAAAVEENKLLGFLKKWWIPIAIIAAVLVFLLIFLIVRHIRKKRKEEAEAPRPEIVGVDNYSVAPGDQNRKNHVLLKNSNLPTKDIVIWISNGRDQPKRMEQHINGSLIVGRSSSCDLYCDDPMMSKQHFAIEIQGDQLNIMDLGSRNGTSLNGSRLIDQQRLENHDEIHAGNLKFTVEW